MKLLMVNESLASGGVERMLVVTANSLSAAPDLQLTLAASGGDLRDCLDSRVAYREIPRFDYLNAAGIVASLTQVIASFKPDIIHSLSATLAVLAGIARDRAGSRAERVLTYHSSAARRVPAPVANVLFKLYADHMVAITRSKFEALLSAGWPRSRLSLIPNCLAIEADGAWDRDSARRDLGLDPEEAVVSMTGRLVREKGWDTFIAALVEASGRSRRHLTGLLLGDGPERERLRGLAERHGRAVTFKLLGYQAQVRKFLAASDLFLFPSRHKEVLPMALIEAAAAGVPIVASDLPGNAEVVVHGGNGYLVAGQARDFAEKVLALLEAPELHARFAENGRRLARERFSLDRVMPELVTLYRRLLQADAPAAASGPSVLKPAWLEALGDEAAHDQ